MGGKEKTHNPAEAHTRLAFVGTSCIHLCSSEGSDCTQRPENPAGL